MIPYIPIKLIDVGLFKINTWSLGIVIAFLVMLWLAEREAKKNKKFDVGIVHGLLLFGFIGGIVGGRLFYVLLNYSFYENNFWEVFKIWDGGVASFGGFVLGLLLCLVYLKKRKVSFWLYADLMAPYVALGLAIVRIGCFLNGCCFGIPTSLPWGMSFPEAPDNLLRHPTQIYSSFNALLIFFILKKNHYFFKVRFVGFTALLSLILYSFTRFFIDFLRWYPSNDYFGFLTKFQYISIAIFIVAFGIIFFKKK